MSEILLNPDLIKKQKLDDEAVMQIMKWHQFRLSVFDIMAETDDPIWLHRLAAMVEEIEYELQRLWRFPRSRDHHTWWNRVPKCRCPRMDNAERYGTPYRIISGACPVHGELK